MTIFAQDLLTIFANRRSFGLKDIDPSLPVEQSAIEYILEAANWAPSHGQTEPWRFVVYQGAGTQRLSSAFGEAFRAVVGTKATAEGEQKQRDKAFMAPVWIAIGVEPDPQQPEWEEMIAVGCAVQNAHLMASHLGLAAKWSSSAVATSEYVAAFIGWQKPIRLLGFLYIGHPKRTWPQGSRRPWQDKVRWEA